MRSGGAGDVGGGGCGDGGNYELGHAFGEAADTILQGLGGADAAVARFGEHRVALGGRVEKNIEGGDVETARSEVASENAAGFAEADEGDAANRFVIAAGIYGVTRIGVFFTRHSVYVLDFAVSSSQPNARPSAGENSAGGGS
jgi:hypothetical protein